MLKRFSMLTIAGLVAAIVGVPTFAHWYGMVEIQSPTVRTSQPVVTTSSPATTTGPVQWFCRDPNAQTAPVGPFATENAARDAAGCGPQSRSDGREREVYTRAQTTTTTTTTSVVTRETPRYRVLGGSTEIIPTAQAQILMVSGGRGGAPAEEGGGEPDPEVPDVANLWVDTNGGTCTRQSAAGAYVDAQACSSLNAAYQAASAGDWILVQAGTYGSQTLASKSPASTISIAPYDGATVVTGTVHINGSKEIDFYDMEFGELQVHMNSDQITFRNIDVDGYLGYDGGDNISMIGGSVGPLNNFHPQIAPSDGSGWQGQGNNFLFDGVYFHDMRRDADQHTECLQVAGTTGMIIRNSRFVRCAVFGLSFTAYNGSGTVNNLTLENNFLDASVDGGFYAVNLTEVNGLLARFNSSNQAWITQAANNASHVYTGNNINGGILNGSGNCVSGSIATYNYNVTNGRDCSASDVNAAPGFVDTGDSDLRLSMGATAIDFVPTGQGCPAEDIDGTTRPVGSACDAGAHEYP